eukprot:7674910-Alexandrium_andersonii.AAC.1
MLTVAGIDWLGWADLRAYKRPCHCCTSMWPPRRGKVRAQSGPSFLLEGSRTSKRQDPEAASIRTSMLGEDP